MFDVGRSMFSVRPLFTVGILLLPSDFFLCKLTTVNGKLPFEKRALSLLFSQAKKRGNDEFTTIPPESSREEGLPL